jgi:hypothetical protein
MPKEIDPDKLAKYLAKQLETCQIAWMDAVINTDVVYADQYEKIMDVLYDFGNKFLDMPIPAPGQGYEPPVEVYTKITKGRALAQIESEISALERLRQEIKDQ